MAKISVCIPVYNPGKYIVECVESVLNQSFRDFDLIILDDCSTEPINDLLSPFFNDNRVIYEKNSTNLGLPSNWNRCIDLASSEYITIFHQDDRMLPSNLALKYKMMHENPDVGMVHSNIFQINETGENIGGHYVPQPDRDQILDSNQIFSMVAEYGNPFACQSVLARQECYTRIGKFNPKLQYATDLEMWMRIASRYRLGYLSQPLVEIRIHRDQVSSRFRQSGKDYLDVLQAYDLIFNPNLPPCLKSYSRQAYDTLARRAFLMTKFSLKSNQFRAASRYMQVFAISQLRKRILTF